MNHPPVFMRHLLPNEKDLFAKFYFNICFPINCYTFFFSSAACAHRDSGSGPVNFYR